METTYLRAQVECIIIYQHDLQPKLIGRRRANTWASQSFGGGFAPCAGKGRPVAPESPEGNEMLRAKAREHRYFQTWPKYPRT